MAAQASNFHWLEAEWPDLFESASKAETLAHADARAACFYARRTLELAVYWLYKHDPALKLPYQEHLSALIHEPTFREAVGPAVFAKARVLKELGNLAVHSHKPVRQFDAITATRELFHFCFWLARTYARGTKPADGLTFNPNRLKPELPTLGVPPSGGPAAPQTQEQLQRLETQLRERDDAAETRRIQVCQPPTVAANHAIHAQGIAEPPPADDGGARDVGNSDLRDVARARAGGRRTVPPPPLCATQLRTPNVVDDSTYPLTPGFPSAGSNALGERDVPHPPLPL